MPLLSCATQPHFYRVFFLSSSRSRSDLDTTVHFRLSLVGKQLYHYFYIHSLSTRVAAFVPCLCEMVHVLGCCFAVWSYPHGYREVSWDAVKAVCCWRGVNPFLTFLFLELVQLFECFFASLNCQQQEAIIIENSFLAKLVAIFLPPSKAIL